MYREEGNISKGRVSGKYQVIRVRAHGISLVLYKRNLPRYICLNFSRIQSRHGDIDIMDSDDRR